MAEPPCAGLTEAGPARDRRIVITPAHRPDQAPLLGAACPAAARGDQHGRTAPL
ncbi:hypothetical protein ACWDGI_21165 [Streptomyces sp. NPDC001220]